MTQQLVGRPGDPGLRPQRGRLRGARRAAGGRRVPARRRPGRRRHGRWSTPAASSRQAKKDSVDTLLEAADLKDAGRPAGGGGRRLPGRAVRRGPRRVAARGRRGARLRRLPRHRRAAALDRGGRDPQPHTPQDRRSCCRSPGRPRCCRSQRPGTRRRPGRRRRPPAPRRTPPPRRRPDGAAQAGQRLRPPLLLLRDPELPRLVREPPPHRRPRTRRAGWPPRACASCSWSARTPRPTARTSATSGCSRRCCPSSPPSTASTGSGSSYLQPAETRPGLVEAIADHAGRGAVLRPLLPARQRRRAAPDAPLRRPRELPRPARPGPAPRTRGRRPLQRHRRLPRRDRGRPRRRSATSWSRPGSTSPGSSATPTRTAPRPRRYDDKLDEDEVRARVEHVTDLVEELDRRSGPRSASARTSTSWSSRRRRRRSSRAAPPTRGPRSTAPRPCSAPATRVGDLVAAVVVGQRGRRPGGRAPR